MTSLRIINCNKPQVKLPKLLCDDEIHPKLNQFPLTELMNRSFACLIAGKAGTGKTSLLVSFLSSPSLFKRCFDKIFVFMPPNSRASLKDSIFELLPEDQVFDELNLQTLGSVFERVESHSAHDERSLIVFDDVQNFFKGECERLITHMIANRRHNRLSMFFIAQSYKKVPRMCRLGMSDVFCFRLSKSDMDDIKNELIDIDQPIWDSILRAYNKVLKTNPRVFLYINPNSNRIFFDWNEVEYSDESKEC